MAEQGPMSGFRDMLAEQMIPREEMIDTIKGVYEGYGFVPLKTPALERLSTLQGKYGEEGDQLMYKFADNGGRMVALRYDQTVPLARVVAQYSGRLPLPYKRYAVGDVWRGESPQAGRYREFMQFDADTVGTKSAMADAEIVAMMSDSMEALGAEAVIRVNNRRILDGLVEKAGIESDTDARRLISTIDKVEKIGAARVVSDTAEMFGDETATLVSDYLVVEGTIPERLASLAKLLDGSEATVEGIDNLCQVFQMLEQAGYSTDRAVLDQTIARGLNYYTGIIYETTLKDLPALGSVCSGGRYDNLVEALGGPDLPAVGTSIGVDRLFEGLSQLGKLQAARTNTEVLVTNFDPQNGPEYMKVAADLRKLGVPTEVYYDPDKLAKQMKFANRMGIPFVVLMGPDELSKGVGIIRNMQEGDQIEVPIAELPNVVAQLQSLKNPSDS